MPLDFMDKTAWWTASGVLAAVALAFLPNIWVNFVGYLRFFVDHESFYRRVSRERQRILPFKAPWPSFPIQYFLLDQSSAKAMFATTPALDYRHSIDVMHESVWNVPMVEGTSSNDQVHDSDRSLGRKVGQAAEKVSSSSMTRSKIVPTMIAFEESVRLHPSLRDPNRNPASSFGN
jgi:hypothetical protein